ncbi:MAG: hypothetical protein ACK4GJ_00990 [bacterium]
MNIISIEGADGVGKSTIANLLYQKISENYPDFLTKLYHEPAYFTEEIYSTNINNLSNQKYLTLLFLISRKKLINNLVNNSQKDKENQILIFDRYIDSTVVYQVLLQRTIDFNNLIYIHKKLIFEENELPSLTFVLEADKQDIINRIQQKKGKKLFDGEIEKIELIQNLYKKLPLVFSDRIFFYFNTSKNSPNEIIDKMLRIIESKIVLPNRILKVTIF